ncbi:hypothetical protein JCM9533A_71290 [Catenuloplanes niger JCM 9533]
MLPRANRAGGLNSARAPFAHRDGAGPGAEPTAASTTPAPRPAGAGRRLPPGDGGGEPVPARRREPAGGVNWLAA